MSHRNLYVMMGFMVGFVVSSITANAQPQPNNAFYKKIALDALAQAEQAQMAIEPTLARDAQARNAAKATWNAKKMQGARALNLIRRDVELKRPLGADTQAAIRDMYAADAQADQAMNQSEVVFGEAATTYMNVSKTLKTNHPTVKNAVNNVK